jgi:hypothetical protein
MLLGFQVRDESGRDEERIHEPDDDDEERRLEEKVVEPLAAGVEEGDAIGLRNCPDDSGDHSERAEKLDCERSLLPARDAPSAFHSLRNPCCDLRAHPHLQS